MKHAVLATLILAVIANSAFAHRVLLDAVSRDRYIAGRALFGAGKPCADAAVQVVRVSSGETVVESRTDLDGRFEAGGLTSGEYDVVVDAGFGHVSRMRLTVAAADTEQAAGGSSESGGSSGSGAAAELEVDDMAMLRRLIREEIEPLRHRLLSLEQQTRFRDVLGGIGFIVGIVGLYAWTLARRRHGGE